MSTLAAIQPADAPHVSVCRPAVATAKERRPSRLPGIVLLVVIVLCLLWLLWIIALTAEPTNTVNTLMDTADFDFGTFWLMSNPPPAIVGVGVAGLSIVAAGFVVAMVKTVRMLRQAPQEVAAGPTSSSKVLGSILDRVTYVHTVDGPTADSSSRIKSRTESVKRVASEIAVELLNEDSTTRKRLASGIKFADIFVQCVILGQFLEDGMPVPLCVLFAVTIALNAFTSFIFSVLPYDGMGRIHVLTDTGFDLAVAVLFPVIELLYAKYMFNFDRPLFAVNQAIFPPGFFERFAIDIADPARVELIRHVLDSLRIDSVLKIFTRVGTNVSLCHRFMELAELLRAQWRGVKQHPNVYPKHNRLFSALYGLLFIAIIVCTEESLRTAKAACAMHPECAQHAHRWIYQRDETDLTRCPCISVIDRELEVTRYEDWVTPPSRVLKVGQLATSGYLQTLQLVNRGLETMPDQLRGCKSLKHVSLFYTNTRTLPDWFGEFTNLEFLHIEGKESGPTSQVSLESLPDHLFDKMDKLLLLHIALHRLKKLPSFDGLVNVRSVSLALMIYLKEFPSFDNMRSLERIAVGNLMNFTTFPQLDNLSNLKMFISVERGAFCCNGFLGKCDLSNPLCQYNVLFDLPPVTECVADDLKASEATRAVFAKFNESVCTGVLKPFQLEMPPTQAAMQQCNGMMWRECVVPGYGQGMCYNPRWMPVSCNPSPFGVKMRRQQIALKIGKPCDPEYEAWLGCKAS